MDSPLKRPTGPFKIKPFTEKELMKMEKKLCILKELVK
jgi:hypothetical protein